jgi:hypothetical protein
MQNIPYPISKIINVANELASTGSTVASTGEQIAAAFVLNRMEFLPEGYTVVQAWERLGDWQTLIPHIQTHYDQYLVPW